MITDALAIEIAGHYLKQALESGDGLARARLEAHEDEALPDFMLERHETMGDGIELGEGLGLRHGAQRAVGKPQR